MAAHSTMARLSGVGASAGLLALVAWPFFIRWPEWLQYAFAAAAAAAGLAGAAMLVLTLGDLLFHRRRGRRLRPVRAFDLILGASLLLVSLAELHDAAGLLPAA